MLSEKVITGQLLENPTTSLVNSRYPSPRRSCCLELDASVYLGFVHFRLVTNQNDDFTETNHVRTNFKFTMVHSLAVWSLRCSHGRQRDRSPSGKRYRSLWFDAPTRADRVAYRCASRAIWTRQSLYPGNKPLIVVPVFGKIPEVWRCGMAVQRR